MQEVLFADVLAADLQILIYFERKITDIVYID